MTLPALETHLCIQLALQQMPILPTSFWQLWRGSSRDLFSCIRAQRCLLRGLANPEEDLLRQQDGRSKPDGGNRSVDQTEGQQGGGLPLPAKVRSNTKCRSARTAF
ncbi:hypothetical protein CLAIMM_14205, partial [Cladophialophora immunda]